MRKITFLAFGLISFLHISCKENSNTASSSTMVSSEALNPQKVDELGRRYLGLGRFSGNILVAEEGKVVYNNSFGKADYEKDSPLTEKTIFSLGSFSEFIQNDAGDKLDKMNSLEAESQKAIKALIWEQNLQNTFLQVEAPKHAATGYVHHITAEGPEATPVPHGKDLQLWTTAEDLAKLVSKIAPENLIQDGYYETGGFSYAIRKNGELTVILLSNRRHPVAGEMAESIEHLWKRKPYRLPLPRKETRISPALLEEYAGTYELGPGANLEVVLQNDSLFVLMGPQKVYLKPQSENQFFMDNSEAAIRFEKDTTGTVASAVLLDGFLNGNSIQKQ